MTDREILLALPSQIEIAEALNALPPGPHHETVRRMAAALDCVRSGGWEVVKASAPAPLALDAPRELLEMAARDCEGGDCGAIPGVDCPPCLASAELRRRK